MTVRPPRFHRLIALFIVMVLMLSLFSGCAGEQTVSERPADYGSYGADFARKMALANPARSPGSEGERKTGDLIIAEFKSLGYEPQVFDFTFRDDDSVTRTSRNIVVRIPGTGFEIKDEGGTAQPLTRQVIVGAHYDAVATARLIEEAGKAASDSVSTKSTTGRSQTFVPTWADFNGITDNAASIGALMMIAREMKNQRTGYDVILVAFGAGKSGQAGARHFASGMTSGEIAATDAMYNMEGIYAGDKLYAHAGQNSILPGPQKDYEKRRKLYEATDVYYEHELYTNNRVALYTNQSSIEVDHDGNGTLELYREWTLHESDHTPFDKLGIPIVFFEGFDYNAKTLEEMKESSNPAFTATNGQIKDTPYDSIAFLDALFDQQREISVTATPAASPSPGLSSVTTRTSAGSGATTDATTTTPEDEGEREETVLEDQLTRRINNTAFLILESIRKGKAGAVAR